MTTTTSGAVRGGSRRTPARLLVGPVPGILGVVGFLVTWEIVCRLGVVDTRYIPTASSVLREALAYLGEADFWSALGRTWRSRPSSSSVAVVWGH